MFSSIRESFGFGPNSESLADLQDAIRSSNIDQLDAILSNVDVGSANHEDLMNYLDSFTLCKLSSLLVSAETSLRVKRLLDTSPFDFKLLLCDMMKELLIPTIKKPCYKRFFMRMRKAMAVTTSYREKHFMRVEDCDSNVQLLIDHFGQDIPWEQIATYVLSQQYLVQLDKDRIVSIMQMHGLRESLLNLKKRGVSVELFEMMLTHPANDISSLETLTSPEILLDYNCIDADRLISKLLPSIDTFNTTIKRRLSAYANAQLKDRQIGGDKDDGSNDEDEDIKERMKKDENAVMQDGLFLYLQYRDFINWFLDEQRGGLQKYYSKAFRTTLKAYYEAVGADFSLYVYTPPGILDFKDGLVDPLLLTPRAKYIEKIFAPPTLFHKLNSHSTPVVINNVEASFEVMYKVPDARLIFQSYEIDGKKSASTTFTIFYLQADATKFNKFNKEWNTFITFSLRITRKVDHVELSLIINFHGQTMYKEVPLCTVPVSDILDNRNTNWEHLIVSYNNGLNAVTKADDWAVRLRYRRLPSTRGSEMKDSGFVTVGIQPPSDEGSSRKPMSKCEDILKEARRGNINYTVCMSHPRYRYRAEVLLCRAFEDALSEHQMEQLFNYTRMTTERVTCAQPEVIYYDKRLLHLRPRLQAPVKAMDVAGLVPKNALSEELLQEQRLTYSKSSLQTVCFNCAGFGEFPLYMEKAASDSNNTKTTEDMTVHNESSSSLAEQEKDDDDDDAHNNSNQVKDDLISEDSEADNAYRIKAPKEENVLTLKHPQQLEQRVYDPALTAATMELQIPGQQVKWYHSYNWRQMKNNDGITATSTNTDAEKEEEVPSKRKEDIGKQGEEETPVEEGDFLTYYDKELYEDSKILKKENEREEEGSLVEFDDAMCRLLEEARRSDHQNHVVNIYLPSLIKEGQGIDNDSSSSSSSSSNLNGNSPREMLRGGIEGAMCIDIDTFHMTMVQTDVQSGELFSRRLIRIDNKGKNENKETEAEAIASNRGSSSLRLVSVSPGNSGRVQCIEEENRLIIDVPSPANSFKGSLTYIPSPRDTTNTNSDSERNSNKSNNGGESVFDMSFGNVMTSLFAKSASVGTTNIESSHPGPLDRRTSLPTTKLSNYTKGVTCWVCSGSGTTAKWFCREVKERAEYIDALPKPVDPFASEGEEEESSECPICCGDAKYGLSIECNHLFCEMCAEHSLRAVLESGQFPALCPMCRAEGTKKSVYNKKTHSHEEVPAGEITRPVLTFLQEREVISKEFQFRFVNAMTRTRLKVGTNDDEFFECPHKDCHLYLYRSKPVFDRIGDSVISKLATCPCGQVLCVQCGKAEEAIGFYGKDHHKSVRVRSKGVMVHDCSVKQHMTMAKKQTSIEEDTESFALVSKLGKKCPVCSTFIEKNDGCHIMLCGDTAHGKISLALQKGGCGAIFDWNTLAVLEGDNYIDFNEKRKAGIAITARMLKDWPKCANPACGYFKSTDHATHPLITKGGTQTHNNGGNHCCSGCKNGRGHSQLCHKLKVSDYGDDIIREVESKAAPVKYLVPFDAQLVMLSFHLEDQPMISKNEFTNELQQYFNVNTFTFGDLESKNNSGHEIDFQFLDVDDVCLSMHYAIPLTRNCAIEILPLPLVPRQGQPDLQFQIPLDLAERDRYATFYPTALRNDGTISHPSIHKGGEISNGNNNHLKVGGTVSESENSMIDHKIDEAAFLRQNGLKDNDEMSFCVLIDFGSVQRIKAVRSHLFQKFSVRIGYSADPLPLIGDDENEGNMDITRKLLHSQDFLEDASFESKLRQYYQLKGHDDKLEEVPGILERFRGREDELLALLHYKYAVFRRRVNEKGSVNDLDKINFHELLNNWVLYTSSHSKYNTSVGVKAPFKLLLEEQELLKFNTEEWYVLRENGKFEDKEDPLFDNDRKEAQEGVIDDNDYHTIKPSLELEEERRMLKAALGAEATECPACGHIILKDGGDDNLMCGCEAKAAGGNIKKAIAGGGCGHEFNCRTLAPLGTGKMGEPANNRQWRFQR